VIGTLPLLAIGLLLIGLLAVLSRRAESNGDESFSEPSNDSSPGSPRFEERWKVIVERIFGCEDWDFVLSQGSKELRRLFFCERKQIALCWLPKYATKRARPCAFMSLEPADQGNWRRCSS